MKSMHIQEKKGARVVVKKSPLPQLTKEVACRNGHFMLDTTTDHWLVGE